MEDLVQNPDAKKIADMLREQQMQQLMQSFKANAPVMPLQEFRNDAPQMQNNMGSDMYIAGGQMQDIPVPNGVPQGFFNPPQQFQRGINMTPMMVGGSVPMGEGRLSGNVMGSNVNAPGFSRTGIDQVGLGYSQPVGGGTLSANVNVPTQGSNYNAMLRYNKRF